MTTEYKQYEIPDEVEVESEDPSQNLLQGDVGTISDGFIGRTSVSESQRRFSVLFEEYVFIGAFADGMTEVASGGAGSSITRSLMTTKFISAFASGAVIYSPTFDITDISSIGQVEFVCFVATDQASDQDVFMGLCEENNASSGFFGGTVPADATTTTIHIGFFIADDVLYASFANGTTQTKFDLSGYIAQQGLAITNILKYSFTIPYNRTNNSPIFYINDKEVWRPGQTTNAPSQTQMAGRLADSANMQVLIGVESQDGSPSSRIIWALNNYSVFITRA